MSFGIYTVELRLLDYPLNITQLVVLAGLGWSLHTCIQSWRFHVLSRSLHFCNSFLDFTFRLTCCHSLSLLYNKNTQHEKSMLAVQIPQEFTAWVC